MDRFLSSSNFRLPENFQGSNRLRRAIESAVNKEKKSKRSSTNGKYSPETQFKAAKYALETSVSKASRKFEVPYSTVNTWAKQLQKSQQQRGRPIAAVNMSDFGRSRRGRPPMLGNLDKTVQTTIGALRTAGTPVNRHIAAGVITGVVSNSNPSLLESRGGSIKPTSLQRSVLRRMQYSWRRSTGNARHGKQLSEAKEKMQDNGWKVNIRFLQRRYNIHGRMVANGDETMIKYVPVAGYTMHPRGDTEVRIIGFDDKRGITGGLSGDSVSGMWPSQLIYMGTTNRCLPNTSLAPNDWLFDKTSTHWQQDASCQRWVDELILPKFHEIRNEESLEDDAKGIWMWDLHKTHRIQGTIQKFKDDNIHVVFIPAKATSRLQVMDVSVNKPFEDHLKSHFHEYYGAQVEEQLRRGVRPENVRVSLTLTDIKNEHLKWVVKAYNEVKESNACVNGFQRIFGGPFRYNPNAVVG